MGDNRFFSVESIYKEGQLHSKIAELSQIILNLAQEIESLKKEKNENVQDKV